MIRKIAWIVAFTCMMNAARAQELVQKTTEALKSGAEFLLLNQNADGSFGKNPSPAVAALCAIALADAPIDEKKRQDAIDKAMDYVLKFVKDDGSVRGEPGRHFIFFSDAGYPTYTTAVALLAMHTFKKPEYVPMMRAAREYLKTVQVEDGDNKHFGGYTYGKGGKADMSNTAWAAEALHYTEYLDKEPYRKKDEKTKKSNKELWNAMDEFLKESQNLTEDGKTNEKLDGGFGYRPETLVSSGSMTYAGLKSMIYAKVEKNDPRVKSVLSFVKKNYTVDENPGQERKGYFYYLQTMGKALDALGIDEITLANGEKRNWRKDLAQQLLDMQTSTGAWVNVDGRYQESDQLLVTAYSMITLKFAVKGLK